MARRGGTTGALPAPLPADIVEGLPAWPDLDPAELARVVARSESLSVGFTEPAAAALTAATVAGAAAARLSLGGRLTVERGSELVSWAAVEADVPEDEARAHVFLRTLLEVVASAPSPGRALDGLLAAVAALGPAQDVRVELGGRSRPAPEMLEIPLPGADGVLVLRPEPGAEARCRAFAEEAVGVVAMTLRSPSRGSSADLSKLEAAERRLRRLALDLHDGPAQDVAALSADTALLVADLEEEHAARALAAEIRDRLYVLGRDIRDLAEVLEPRAILREPLRAVLEREAAAFVRRSGVPATVDVDDDLGVMTASQQIALVRVAQEALANVREHARASSVQLTAARIPHGVSLVIADDGRGFDVPRAAKRGRLGLAGMNERILLLGGRLLIESRPGGGTRVHATIPRWRPSA